MLRRLVWIVVATTGLTTSPGRAAESPIACRPRANLLPESIALYAEIANPSQTLGVILDHPFRSRLEALHEFQAVVRRKEYIAFQAGLAYVESRLGMEWREALEKLSQGGIAFAIDIPTQGVAVVLTAADEQSLTHIREELLAIVGEDLNRKGRTALGPGHVYRGQTVHQIGNGLFFSLGVQLVAVSHEELARGIIDRHLETDWPCLANHPGFAEARSQIADDAAAWSWVDLNAVRAFAEQSGKPLQTQTDNPLAELILGGLLDTLKQTPWLSASAKLHRHGVALTMQAPHLPDWVGPDRAFFFGPDGRGQAPAGLEVQEELLSLSAYRDLASLWLHAGDLFPERISDKFAEADSTLMTLFSGRDFGEEILGAFKPQVQLIVAAQSHADDAPQIRLPAFALVLPLRRPEVAGPELRRMFQNLVGFVNITGAMNGQLQLDLERKSEPGLELITAHYVPPAHREAGKPLPFQFNFSPSIAIAGPWFVLSSSEELARRVATAAGPQTITETTSETTRFINLSVVLEFSALRRALMDNESHLVAQNILKEGHTRPEAERQVDLLISLLDRLRDLRLELVRNAEHLSLHLELRLRDDL